MKTWLNKFSTPKDSPGVTNFYHSLETKNSEVEHY